MTNTDEVPATCPYDISFDLTNRDGSPILGSVFTWTGGGTQTIGTFTNDKTKIGVYPMRLHIKYFQHDQLTTNYYDFDIEIVDPCLNNAILIPEPQTDPICLKVDLIIFFDESIVKAMLFQLIIEKELLKVFSTV